MRVSDKTVDLQKANELLTKNLQNVQRMNGELLEGKAKLRRDYKALEKVSSKALRRIEEINEQKRSGEYKDYKKLCFKLVDIIKQLTK